MVSEAFNITTLRALDIFAPLSDAELEHLRPAVTIEDHNIGDVILREGDEGDAMWVLLVGEVKVVKGHRTQEERVLAVIEPVRVFGEMALVRGSTRSATVVATDSCRFLRLHREALEGVLLRHPAVCLALLKEAYRRISELPD